MRHDVANSTVMATSGLVGLFQSIPAGLVSLTVGILGVALARWIFVNREVRRTNQPQRWYETLPMTLMAMLVTGVLVIDRKLSLSTSAFLGLGVGWVAVLLLDIFGDKVLTIAKTSFAAGPSDPHVNKKIDHSGHDGFVDEEVARLPDDMKHALKQLDDRDTTPKDII